MHAQISRIIQYIQDAHCCTNKSLRVDYHIMKTKSSKHSQPQNVHQDAPESGVKKQCYFTIIIPLTNDNYGVDPERHTGTWFDQPFYVYNCNNDDKEWITDVACVNIYRGAALWSGMVKHRGLANKTGKERVSLMVAVYSGEDPNEPPDHLTKLRQQLRKKVNF